jgi:hypothetical protein
MYAVCVFGFIAYSMVEFTSRKDYNSVIGAGVNFLIWAPFVGRALGWW